LNHTDIFFIHFPFVFCMFFVLSHSVLHRVLFAMTQDQRAVKPLFFRVEISGGQVQRFGVSNRPKKPRRERLNATVSISLERALRLRIDQRAEELGITRTAYILQAVESDLTVLALKKIDARAKRLELTRMEYLLQLVKKDFEDSL
jgi:hypothetical protein